jgi:hypothetical protein
MGPGASGARRQWSKPIVAGVEAKLKGKRGGRALSAMRQGESLAPGAGSAYNRTGWVNGI